MLAYIKQLISALLADIFYALITIIIIPISFYAFRFIFCITKPKISDTVKTMQYSHKVLMMLIVFFALGLIFIMIGFTISAPHPIASTMFTSIGTLFMFGTSYSCYTDFVSNRGVVSEIEDMITSAIDLKEKHRTIEDMGIQEIIKFDTQELLNKMGSSKSCKMIYLYNLNFVKIHYSTILKLVKNGLRIEIIMSDPSDNSLFECLEKSFDRLSAETIKENASKAFNFLCENVCKKCSKNVKINTINWPSTYSAYVFDEKEMWLLPRHTSKGKKEPYVLVIKKTDHASSNFFFQDIIDTLAASTPHNECSTCRDSTPSPDQTPPTATNATTAPTD